jgi:hypothetical protein
MKYKIFVVSGGTGRTAKQVVRAALTQFPDESPEIVVFSDVTDIKKVQNIIEEAQKYGAVIVHTIVEDHLREFVKNECDKFNIYSVDFMGDIIFKFSKLFSSEPLQSPGLFNKINKEYFQRIDTTQFAFKHDDGARVEDIEKAEIIILGVSRTFKSPLSIYLAYKGYFVINIPIIDGMQPPIILNDVDPNKVFCLTTNANKLSELRTIRNKQLGGYAKDYLDIDAVKKELLFAMRYFTLHPKWQIVNVTNKSIEEIASEILDHLKDKLTYLG